MHQRDPFAAARPLCTSATPDRALPAYVSADGPFSLPGIPGAPTPDRGPCHQGGLLGCTVKEVNTGWAVNGLFDNGRAP
ncbi:hypothetical protein GCM10023259_102610 [Thermocatellispora tengchongensis]